jgi:Arm DNA-binding domain/Phage integrase central domain
MATDQTNAALQTKIAELEAENARLRRRTSALRGKLTASKIANISTKNGTYGDGGNLWLQITNNGAGQSWLFRWSARGTGRERVMGLGSLRTIDLDRARELARGYRQMLLEGKDPKAERDDVKFSAQVAAGLVRTVGQVADEYFEQRIAHKSPGHRKSATYLLKTHVHDRIGHMPIQKVNRNTILETCGFRELWTQQNQTARKVLVHLNGMFMLAKARHYFHGENPAAWKEGLKYVLQSSSDIHQVKHHPGPDYKDMFRFMQRLRSSEDRSPHKRGRPMVTFVIEFLALTGVRSAEVRFAT